MRKFDINDFCRFFNITETEARAYSNEFFSAPDFKAAEKVFKKFIDTHTPDPEVLPEYMEMFEEEEE